MKKLMTFAIGALALMLVSQPAMAICGGGAGDLITYTGTPSFVYSNPGWCGASVCVGTGPALTSNTKSAFWALGFGNPTPGAGADNGNFGGSADLNYPSTGTQWLLSTVFGSFYFAGQTLGGWGTAASVDGCVLDNPGTCSCVLITDDRGDGVGRYALISNTANMTGQFLLSQPGGAPIQLQPIPAPGIAGTTRLGNFDVDVDVKIPNAGSGLYELGGCTCAPTGFKVVQQILPRGSGAPVSRDVSGWAEPNTSGGGSQGTANFGVGMSDGVQVRSECGASDTDVYFATQLLFPDGFSAGHVSANSGKMECGMNLAEPEPQKRPGVDRQGREPVQRRRGSQGR